MIVCFRMFAPPPPPSPSPVAHRYDYHVACRHTPVGAAASSTVIRSVLNSLESSRTLSLRVFERLYTGGRKGVRGASLFSPPLLSPPGQEWQLRFAEVYRQEQWEARGQLAEVHRSCVAKVVSQPRVLPRIGECQTRRPTAQRGMARVVKSARSCATRNAPAPG